MSGETFMLTAGGREYLLAGPRAMLGNAPSIEDIAHHLAQINRYTGACSRPYSVAEHSLLVERIGAARGARTSLRLALLMHDAHEAYTQDLSTPAKHAVGAGWIGFEALHANNVRRHFGLRTAFAAHRGEIRACDLIALATERRDLTAYDAAVHHPWPILDTPGQEVRPSADERLPRDEPPRSWRGMREAFITRYLELRGQLQAEDEARLQPLERAA
jgi:hypothetical protein